MHTTPSHQGYEEYTLAGGEALLAITLSLMTGHLQADCAGQQALFSKKIVAHLAQLTEDSLLSPGFKTLLGELRARWVLQGQYGAQHCVPGAAAQAWHASPPALQ